MTYRPTDGRKLTPLEDEVLTVLAEECNEIAIAVSKIRRFTLGNADPGTGLRNDFHLAQEFGNLTTMAILAKRLGLLNAEQVQVGVVLKAQRFSEYAQSDLGSLVVALDALQGSDPERPPGGWWYVVKRDLYYRPNAAGYTGIRDEAGKYTHEEALGHEHVAGGVTIVHESEAPEFRAAAFTDLVVRHLTRQRDALRLQLAELKEGGSCPQDRS